jgi:hypothetical protein
MMTNLAQEIITLFGAGGRAGVVALLLAMPTEAQESACHAPAQIADRAGGTLSRVRDYRAIFQHCRNGDKARLAIRSMSVDGAQLLLTVDPQSLATHIESAQCWTCAETTDAAQSDTRYLRAKSAASEKIAAVSTNAGIVHGAGAGSFVTGDLCPSRKPLDRAFIELLAKQGPHTPVTLAISGQWITHHGADFEWLREKARSGALDITWANHSYRHPYLKGLAEKQNYLRRRGSNLSSEIFDTERLLMAHGETPSVFFRFPGLVADTSLMQSLAARHLVALGADAWLVLSPPPRPGSIVLVHPNGNEPAGLKIFSRLLEQGKFAKPFRPINEAP